ncbi:MAG: efflux RND transporter periplasmic adaptor subunit [Bacteroidales bacterium]|nr:efflux RND transporter periplasmic adaptor subunit [Bacteroidales bacterium]MCR5037665.1 efflux RND transporter periplasmic adaptor subunit [Bacteroidales bacterium]
MKKVFKILFFIALGAAVIWTFSYLFKKSQPQQKMYETVEATIGTIQKKTVITGQINPRDEVAIKPQVSGIISQIYKEAGEMVKKDEVIATVKIIPDVANLTASESQVRIAKLNLDNVEKMYERQKSLKDKGLIASEEYEKSLLEYEQAKENYNNALDQLNIVKEGISKNASEYTNTSIKSTIDGMILDVPVKVGNSVINSNTFNDGTTIATVADMRDMIFVGKMDETEVGRISEGMPMKITIGAMNDKTFDAELEYIAPKGTSENGAVFFQMKARMIIPDDITLRAGYSANGEIIIEQAVDAVTVPESCIIYSNDSTFVYKNDMKTPVKTGLSDGINIVITEGLDAGDKIRGNEIFQ